MGPKGLFLVAQKNLGNTAKWVLGDQKIARVKNYKQVLIDFDP